MRNSIFSFLIFCSSAVAFAKEASIACDDKKPKTVRVVPGRVTVLNFPFKPREVVPGSNAFDFKQIKNDLIIRLLAQALIELWGHLGKYGRFQ